MIRPVNFSFNAETAINNAFQKSTEDDEAQQKALEEFNGFAALLRDNGVDVTVIDDKPEPNTPDSIFPNNWISFHEDGTICLFPMFARNRRLERKPEIIRLVAEKFQVGKTVDLSAYESSQLFLEGTGSMVLDRENKIAYACLSPRTDKKLLSIFCDMQGYRPISFIAQDGNGQPIYHTNVMMCIADQFAVVCTDSIVNREERNLVTATLKECEKEIIDISLEQMNHFAGNMLQVQSLKGEKLLVMSNQAYESLSTKQVKKLEGFNRILHSSLNVIETNGGGSARCMLAEIHLPIKKHFRNKH